MSKDNGGPAFPIDRMVTAEGNIIVAQGVTVRDYFEALEKERNEYRGRCLVYAAAEESMKTAQATVLGKLRGAENQLVVFHDSMSKENVELHKQLASAQAELAQLKAQSSEPVTWWDLDGKFYSYKANDDCMPLYAAAPRDEVEKLRRDAERLDWLEERCKASRTGVSFVYSKHSEGGYVTEKGYRFMKFNHLGEPKTSIRAAIDAARKGEE